MSKIFQIDFFLFLFVNIVVFSAQTHLLADEDPLTPVLGTHQIVEFEHRPQTSGKLLVHRNKGRVGILVETEGNAELGEKNWEVSSPIAATGVFSFTSKDNHPAIRQAYFPDPNNKDVHVRITYTVYEEQGTIKIVSENCTPESCQIEDFRVRIARSDE